MCVCVRERERESVSQTTFVNKSLFPSNESKRTKPSLLVKLALYIIIVINDELLAPQSEQTKHKNCCQCVRR